MKAIDLYVNSLLPPELQDLSRPMNKKTIEKLLSDVALTHPDKYSDILKGIADVGRHTAYHQGETLRLNDFRPVIDKDAILQQMDGEIEQAKATSKSPKEAEQRRNEIWAKYASSMEQDTMAAALKSHNSLGHTVVSGARGNSLQLKSMITTPALYTDYRGQTIPRFVRNSFGEGLRPSDYLASMFGVRQSVISTKSSTSKGGDYLKQLSQAGASQVVTQSDCGTGNGLDFNTDDSEINGRVLAQAAGGLKPGDVLDKRHVAELKRNGVKSIVVRSPLTCQSKEGICAHCYGTLEGGKFPKKGYAAGLTAAAALGEPVVQGALNAKHTSGAFKGSKKQFSGFNVINQIAQSPETFPYKAAVSEKAGRVDSITDAPQGGKFVSVDGHKHYVLPDYDINVKTGDQVEAGDQLSDGVVDASDIVRLRGLGEGRRYWVNRMQQAYEESGIAKPSKLNLETLARATLDHVRVDADDGIQDYLPDDIASYNHLSSSYSPDKETQLLPVDKAIGQHLQAPALHFSIGTKLTPKMVEHLKKAGTAHVAVSPAPPAFVPEMVRLRSAAHYNPDWMARLHSSYLTTTLEEAAGRSRDSSPDSNVHLAPPLMKGDQFGKKVETTGKF